MTKRLITLTGELGSGKSSVSHALAKILGWGRYSAGDAQREIAKQRGMTTLELNLLAEQDPSIDRHIDGVFAQLQVTGKNLVIDSRMAWFFVPDSLKIRLVVSLAEAAHRVHHDDGRVSEEKGTVEETFESLRQRGKSEHRRFKKYYNVEIEDDTNYDFVVSTDMVSAEAVAGLIACLLKSADGIPGIAKYWVSPRDLFPTQDFATIDLMAVEVIERRIALEGFNPLQPIKVAARKHDYFIVDGHKRASAAIAAGIAFVPLVLAQEGDPLLHGKPLEVFVAAPTTTEKLAAWEQAHGYKFNRDVL